MACFIDKFYGGEIHFSVSAPRLILVCGPCRVGTTALSNVFAKAGVESHMQPIKSARRATEMGEKIVPWNIGTNDEEFAVAKETFGPHGQSEFFNPVEILLKAGYPAEKLAIIPILREPAQVFSSWKRMWRVAKLRKLVRAYELTAQVKERAESEGIFVFPYVHEIIRDNPPAVVLALLFERMGLTIQQLSMVFSARWGDLKESENVFFYDNPPDRFVDGIKERGKYEYRELFVSEEDRGLVESVSRLKMIYEVFHESCEANLGLKAIC